MDLKLKKAKFYNPNIAEMASFKYEGVFGWVFHYYLSICWAIIYYICFILIGLKMSYFSIKPLTTPAAKSSGLTLAKSPFLAGVKADRT